MDSIEQTIGESIFTNEPQNFDCRAVEIRIAAHVDSGEALLHSQLENGDIDRMWLAEAVACLGRVAGGCSWQELRSGSHVAFLEQYVAACLEHYAASSDDHAFAASLWEPLVQMDCAEQTVDVWAAETERRIPLASARRADSAIFSWHSSAPISCRHANSCVAVARASSSSSRSISVRLESHR